MAALELGDGSHVNYVSLGVGPPTLVSNDIREGRRFMLQSENGILSAGPCSTEDAVDPDLVDAGTEAATVLPGASFFDSARIVGECWLPLPGEGTAWR